MKKNEIEKSLQQGMKFLNKSQKKDGSFGNLVSCSKKFVSVEKNSAIFSTCLIISSLSKLKNSKKIEGRASEFLLGQKSEFWSWNHWQRNSLQSMTVPYPDDMNNTSCALSALSLYNQRQISTKAITKILMLLTACESKEGGPYCTWLVPENANKNWKDVDLAVNNNIAFFLSMQDVFLPSLVGLVEKAIGEKKYHSPYYFSEYSVIYFISRWYRKKKKNEIVAHLLSRQLKNGSWGNSLDTALAISALVNFGYKKENLEKSIAYLLGSQVDGKWEVHPFMVELIKKKQKYYSGSPELTTAFCLEALEKCLSHEKTVARKSCGNMNLEAKRIHEKIVANVRDRFEKLGCEMQNSFLEILKKTLRTDKIRQITLLAYYFQKSFGEPFDEKKIIKLGQASLFGWLAYAIYDDFYDDEGKAPLLSVANVCLRELTLIFQDFFSERGEFLNFFNDIMDDIDRANQWEFLNCRAFIQNDVLTAPEKMPQWEKNESKLAERSMGHALGPVALQYLSGFEIQSDEIQNLLQFFRHYIIARQLNDDAHDWEEDLKRGQLSPVVVLILEEYVKQNKIRNLKNLDLKKEIKVLQKIFWTNVVQKTCKKTLLHIDEARNFLELNAMQDKSFFENMLVPVENSAEKAILEQKEMMEFLKEYK